MTTAKRHFRQAGASPSPLALLGVPAAAQDMARVVVDRLPVNSLQKMQRAGYLSSGEIYALVLPARTLSHRKTRKEPLSVDESDRLVRLARLMEQAFSTFGNPDKALAWLRQSSPRFEGYSPLELAQTEHGGRLVEESLIQLDEGFFP